VPSERVDELLDALGDERARQILAAVTDEPQSAKELATSLEASLPTVYRRIDDLKAADLVSAQTAVAPDGNHFERYTTTFESLSVRIRDGDYVVDIERTEGIADRFDDLWSELGEGR